MQRMKLLLKALVVALGLFALATTPSHADASSASYENGMLTPIEGSTCSFCYHEPYCPSPATVNTWCQIYGAVYDCYTGGTCSEETSDCRPWARLDCF